MTSPQDTIRYTRCVGHGRTRTKALGALAGLALTAGFVVVNGGPASARNCDIGASACRGVQAQSDLVSRVRYP